MMSKGIAWMGKAAEWNGIEKDMRSYVVQRNCIALDAAETTSRKQKRVGTAQ
jgi:hypothetical protein